MKTMREAVCELSALHGVSSREDEVIRYMKKELAGLCDEVSVDVLGNVTGKIACGQANAQRLMVFAHTDEVGFIIRKVEKNGFLRIQRMGGIHQTVLAGLSIDVLGDKGVVPGVIGIRSHHVEKPEEKRIVPAVDDLYVDIGAQSAEEAESMGVHTGCLATYTPGTRILGRHLISGKTMDNRCCCAVLLHYAAQVKSLQKDGALHWDVYIVACVQEEFNVRGIMPAVERIQPNVSIGLDICIASDTPELAGFTEICLGGGPAVTYMNFHGRGTLAGVLPDKGVQSALEETCKADQIPFQREVISGLITENAFIGFSGQGVAVANLSVPCRYSHTPIETIDERDLSAMVRLLSGFTKRLLRNHKFGKNTEREDDQ